MPQICTLVSVHSPTESTRTHPCHNFAIIRLIRRSRGCISLLIPSISSQSPRIPDSQASRSQRFRPSSPSGATQHELFHTKWIFFRSHFHLGLDPLRLQHFLSQGSPPHQLSQSPHIRVTNLFAWFIFCRNLLTPEDQEPISSQH
jgi:hypothetical protein